ncbi:MAG: type II toxin-antitoxin system PemK/MazF family toxin [Opitutaceae bacterium]|nr:type II toxin-antitoxin system PemK/MazF family toxin [Opitutaceae bacterium]
MRMHQWDIVRVRINPNDKDEHPAIVISREEWCQDDRKLALNVLYGTTNRPAEQPGPCDVPLNGADGLERLTLVNCEHIFSVSRTKIISVVGRVSVERRRQIGRMVVMAYRLPL